MTKVYKTANGQKIDMERMRLQNEQAPAIGNMHVNARGDEIDSRGNIVRTRNDIVRDSYKNKIQQTDN